MWNVKIGGIIYQIWNLVYQVFNLNFVRDIPEWKLPYDGCSLFWGTLFRVLLIIVATPVVALIPVVPLSILFTSVLSIPANIFLTITSFGGLFGLIVSVYATISAFFAILLLGLAMTFIVLGFGYILFEIVIPYVFKILKMAVKEEGARTMITPVTITAKYIKAKKQKYCPRVEWTE